MSREEMTQQIVNVTGIIGDSFNCIVELSNATSRNQRRGKEIKLATRMGKQEREKEKRDSDFMQRVREVIESTSH